MRRESRRLFVAHKVVFSPEARTDLRNLYLFIAERAGDARAVTYVEQVADYCRGFSTFPDRGTRRDDVTPGLRLIGFKRRVAIAFHVDQTRVVIDRIFYGGRDIPAQFDEA